MSKRELKAGELVRIVIVAQFIGDDEYGGVFIEPAGPTGYTRYLHHHLVKSVKRVGWYGRRERRKG